jgi:hypothetical protein
VAAIPHLWEAYARFQRKLSLASCIATGAAFEEALNVVHAPDFQPGDTTEACLRRAAASAARSGRHRALLRRQARTAILGDTIALADDNDGPPSAGALSLEDAIHARRELNRIAASVCEDDWHLLTEVAVGTAYSELALKHGASTAALRSRVCRLREAIVSR